MTPFRWKAEWPSHRFVHPLRDELVAGLRNGEAHVVYGGRGMGKTVLLREVTEALEALSFPVVRVEAGPGPLSAALLDVLPTRSRGRLRPALEAIEGPVALVIDEIDGREPREARETLDLIGSLSRTALDGRLGVLVAGGVGAFRLSGNPTGSPFASRINATHFLNPVSAEVAETWSAPLRGRSPEYDGDWLEAARIASGGIPLLLAALLEAGWREGTSALGPLLDPVAWLRRFIERQDGYRRSVRDSVQLGGAEGPAAQLLGQIHVAQGRLTRAAIREVKLTESQAEDQIRLFAAAGLVTHDNDFLVDPWRVAPLPSMLRLFGSPPRPAGLEEVVPAVEAAARQIAANAVDFWHGRGSKRRILPEATFSAFVAVQLHQLGFLADREAQRGPGRTDLVVRIRGLEGEVVVEVKIWKRNDYRDIEAQAQSYLREGSHAACAFMIADEALPDVEYAREVLRDPNLVPAESAGELRRWRRQVPRADGHSVPITHLLLCLPRRT